MRLNEILGAESAPETLMPDILAALQNIPQIEACCYEKDGRAWHGSDPEMIGDWRADTRAAAWPGDVGHLNIHAAAAVKLRQRGAHGGVLVLYSNTKQFFPEVWNAAFLAHLGVLIGNALENRQTRAALQRAQTLYQTLFNGADVLLSPRSEATVLKRLCKTIVDSGLFVSAGVGTVSAGGLHRHVAAAAQRNAQALRAAHFHIADNQPVRPLTVDAWLADKTMIENNYFSNPRHEVMYGLARRLGFRSVAAMIIRRGGVRWAVMSVSAAETNYFNDELIHLLERMAGMVGHRLDELDLKAALRAEREAQSRIARQDALTLLPNRLAFHEQLAGAMARAVRHGANAGIAMLDLDDFKRINDQWGHAAGDHVLCTVGSRIRAMLREVDFIARLGGDEFALILEGWASPPERWAAEVEAFCNRLKEAVSAPLTLPSGEIVSVSLSAGFTMFPPVDLAADLLVRRADIALYAAKAAKGETGRFWRLHGEPAAAGAELRGRALLQSGALVVHFQPVLNLDAGEIIAVEALARLRDGDNLIRPPDFLPELKAEDRCLLFRLVLEASLNQLTRLDQVGVRLSVSVNLDAQVFLRDTTLPYLKKKLAAYGIEPRRLMLELLETHEFHDLGRAAAQISAMRAHGICVALDDAGAGYASILKIRELPLDAVKLNRGFLGRLRQQPDDVLFISIMQTLTAALGIKLVVEGVEDEDVLDALSMIGVRDVQGFLIAKPMDGATLTEWLRAYRPRRAWKLPETLLGAYAMHSNWVRSFEFYRAHASALERLQAINPFSLDGFFAGQGSRYTAARDAYNTLQSLLQHTVADRASVQDAAGQFRGKLTAALKAEA